MGLNQVFSFLFSFFFCVAKIRQVYKATLLQRLKGNTKHSMYPFYYKCRLNTSKINFHLLFVV